MLVDLTTCATTPESAARSPTAPGGAPSPANPDLHAITAAPRPPRRGARRGLPPGACTMDTSRTAEPTGVAASAVATTPSSTRPASSARGRAPFLPWLPAPPRAVTVCRWSPRRLSPSVLPAPGRTLPYAWGGSRSCRAGVSTPRRPAPGRLCPRQARYPPEDRARLLTAPPRPYRPRSRRTRLQLAAGCQLSHFRR